VDGLRGVDPDQADVEDSAPDRCLDGVTVMTLVTSAGRPGTALPAPPFEFPFPLPSVLRRVRR
jgi:hypothetical protein